MVADEVRNLAMRAAEAAKNTASLIEDTVKKVKSGSDIVIKTSETFEKVAAGARRVAELVGEISTASNEQAQGIEQINKAVMEMDRIVQQNATSAEESASASEVMNALAEQLKQLIQELAELVKGDVQKLNMTGILPLDGGNGRRPTAIGRLTGSGLPTVLPKPASKGNGKKPQMGKFKEVNPEEMIPLEKWEVKEF